MREPATSYIIHGQCVILGETFSPGSLADYHFKLCRESHQDIPSLSKSWTMIIADMLMVNKPPMEFLSHCLPCLCQFLIA